jgi:hypothetical protein
MLTWPGTRARRYRWYQFSGAPEMTLFFVVLFCALLVSPLPAVAGEPEELPKSDRCLLKPDPGPCKALFQYYYYDAAVGKCREFIYGGCAGAVPFKTVEECRAACESGNSSSGLSKEGNSQSSSGVKADEYAVYKALLEQYRDAAHSKLNKQTLRTDLDSKTAAFLREQGMVLDDAIIADFNEKNRIQHDLAPAFVDAHTGFRFREGGRDSIELSGAGLDLQREKAVVFARYTHVHREAFYQEELFLLLERKAGSWIIIKKVTAGLKYY